MKSCKLLWLMFWRHHQKIDLNWKSEKKSFVVENQKKKFGCIFMAQKTNHFEQIEKKLGLEFLTFKNNTA